MQERCEILCKNKECIHWEGQQEKKYFKRTRTYVPFEDDVYTGICTSPIIKFIPIWRENKNYLFKFVTCAEGKFVPNSQEPTIECEDKECMWCFAGFCARDGIAVDKVPYGSGDDKALSCRGQSNKKISGHIDFSRFVKAEGSHLDDPVGYEDRFYSRKEAEIKKLRAAGVPEENLNTIYGREVR